MLVVGVRKFLRQLSARHMLCYLGAAYHLHNMLLRVRSLLTRVTRQVAVHQANQPFFRPHLPSFKPVNSLVSPRMPSLLACCV